MSADEVHQIREPTEKFHGFQVVDHNGTVFIEQIRANGEEVQSMMFSDADDLAALISALIEVSNQHAE